MLTGPGPNELGSKMGEVVEETGSLREREREVML